MDANEFLAKIAKEDFLREIHHLLWIDPHINRGKRDDGWNCRDHALIVGGVARMFGFKSLAVSGAAMFVQGPIGHHAPVGRSVDPHTWVQIENVGAVDVSVRLKGFKDMPKWKDWETSGLVGSQFHPIGRVNYLSTSDPAKYDNSINIATHRVDQKYGIYLRKAAEPIGVDQLQMAFKWCNSPLTVRLSNLFKNRHDLYPKAILHLTSLLKGEATSVVQLPQMKAWATVAGKKSDAIERVCSESNHVGNTGVPV